jgi:hypothetical protein
VHWRSMADGPPESESEREYNRKDGLAQIAIR